MEDHTRTAPPRISVVIPALNEASRLPALLDCLDRQTLRPVEVVLADAGSTDGTAELAAARGVRVVAGGMPAYGRNAGARVVTGDLILFLDADSRPADGFIEMAVAEFDARGLVATGAPIEPVERRWDYVLACKAARVYLLVMQHVVPHAAGTCILVRRDIHEQIHGFDETLVLAEDHDYVRRASALGRFRILTTVTMPVSMRRVEQEGRLRLGLKYVYCEIKTLAGSPITKAPFEYSFGEHDDDPGAPTPAGRTLRGRMARLARMLEKPSTEVQTNEMAIALASLLFGGAAVTAMILLGAERVAWLSVASAAIVGTGLASYAAYRKLRYERDYGDFFTAALAVTSDDIISDDGTLLAARGVDEVWEMHVVRGLPRMAELYKQGHVGRLILLRESYEGIRDMTRDEAISRGGAAKLVTGHSDLVINLVRVGFEEISDPPKLNWVNRLDKRLLFKYIGYRVGRDRAGIERRSRMAVMPTEQFFGPEFAKVVDARIARVAADVERAKARSARPAGPDESENASASA